MTSAPDVSITPPTPSPVPDDRFPGWRVVAGCFFVLMVNAGLAFYGLAVYLNAFSNEKGWALGSISLGVTIFFVVGATAGLWVARLIAAYDVRLVIIAGAALAGAALAALGQVDTVWQLYLVYAVFAVGFAGSGLVPTTTVVTRWFHERRAVALSVASTGLSVGGIVLTPIAKRFIDERGLAATTPWLGLAFFVLIVPVAWFLVRPDPELDGWSPDGVRRVAGESRPVVAGMPYADAVRTRFYRAVTIGYLFALGAQVGGIQQLVKLVEDRTDPATARFAVTALAGTSVVARLVGGRAVQLVPMMRFTVVVGAVQCVALIGLAFVTSTPLIFASIVLFGMAIGNLLMMQPLLIAERFGVADYPRIYGRSQFVAIVGVAGGPLLLGWLYDVSGSYRLPYLAAAACCLIGASILSIGGPATAPAAPPAPERR
ncbi:MAG: MFS transporter [Ilumatobacter sp.]|nr:MFS transporter [Ilumatobacter sp.]